MRYLLIFQGDMGTHISDFIRQVNVQNEDELRGEIELTGEEISERRGVFFACVGVEVPDEDEFDDEY